MPVDGNGEEEQTHAKWHEAPTVHVTQSCLPPSLEALEEKLLFVAGNSLFETQIFISIVLNTDHIPQTLDAELRFVLVGNHVAVRTAHAVDEL